MDVLIIEDERLAADRLKKMICNYDNTIKIVAHLDSIKKAIQWFETNPCPDLAFMDIELGDGGIFKLFELVDIKCPVIFTTAHEEYTFQAFKVYAVDYLLKPMGEIDLKNALDKFKLYNYSVKQSVQACIDDAEAPSVRELEILKLMSQGKSSAEIGELLFISENTVFKHRKNMLKKMNVKNTGELISKAIANGMI